MELHDIIKKNSGKRQETQCGFLCLLVFFLCNLGLYIKTFKSTLPTITSSSYGEKIDEIKSIESFSTFKDSLFEDILKAFKNTAEIPSKKKFRSRNIPSLLLFNPGGKTLKTRKWISLKEQMMLPGLCPRQCYFTGNMAEASSVDALLFDLWSMSEKYKPPVKLPKRDIHQPWITLAFESTQFFYRRQRVHFSNFDNVFNRTMGFRRDADIYMPYGFIIPKSDVSKLPSKWVIPITKIIPRGMNKTRLAVMFLSDCKTSSGRGEYILEMKQYATDIDVIGKCSNLKCGEAKKKLGIYYNVKEDECFQDAATKYFFYFAMENSICKDYVTEKVYNQLHYPIVPIVLGGGDYDNLLPPHSYINAANYSPSDLVVYLRHLRNNPKEYNLYFLWKNNFQPSTIGGLLILCDLCLKLYDPSFYKFNVYSNFSKWFEIDSNCNRRWIKNKGIIPVSKRNITSRIRVFFE